MKAMKTRFIIAASFLMLFLFGTKNSSAVSIHIWGQAGATIQNGQIKVCPGFALRTCATLDISWKDLWEWITSKGDTLTGVLDDSPVVKITLVNNAVGTADKTFRCKIARIDPSLLQGDEHHDIQGDLIDFIMY